MIKISVLTKKISPMFPMETIILIRTSSRIILHRTRELFSRNTQKQTVSSFVRSLQMPRDLYVRVLEMMFRKNVSMSLQRHILW